MATTAIDTSRLYIDGQWTSSASEETLDVVNPTTGEVIGAVPRGTEEGVDRAVAEEPVRWLVDDACRDARGDPPAHLRLAGEIHLQLATEVYDLRAGDSIDYRSSVPHRVSNAGADIAQTMLVSSSVC